MLKNKMSVLFLFYSVQCSKIPRRRCFVILLRRADNFGFLCVKTCFGGTVKVFGGRQVVSFTMFREVFIRRCRHVIYSSLIQNMSNKIYLNHRVAYTTHSFDIKSKLKNKYIPSHRTNLLKELYFQSTVNKLISQVQ